MRMSLDFSEMATSTTTLKRGMDPRWLKSMASPFQTPISGLCDVWRWSGGDPWVDTGGGGKSDQGDIFKPPTLSIGCSSCCWMLGSPVWAAAENGLQWSMTWSSVAFLVAALSRNSCLRANLWSPARTQTSRYFVTLCNASRPRQQRTLHQTREYEVNEENQQMIYLGNELQKKRYILATSYQTFKTLQFAVKRAKKSEKTISLSLIKIARICEKWHPMKFNWLDAFEVRYKWRHLTQALAAGNTTLVKDGQFERKMVGSWLDWLWSFLGSKLDHWLGSGGNCQYPSISNGYCRASTCERGGGTPPPTWNHGRAVKDQASGRGPVAALSGHCWTFSWPPRRSRRGRAWRPCAAAGAPCRRPRVPSPPRLPTPGKPTSSWGSWRRRSATARNCGTASARPGGPGQSNACERTAVGPRPRIAPAGRNSLPVPVATCGGSSSSLGTCERIHFSTKCYWVLIIDFKNSTTAENQFTTQTTNYTNIIWYSYCLRFHYLFPIVSNTNHFYQFEIIPILWGWF